MPWAGSQRYDFVSDYGGGQFTRIQCKAGLFRDGAVYFRTASAESVEAHG